MGIQLRNFILLFSMIASAGMASVLRPVHKTADLLPPLRLEEIIPTRFDEWVLDESGIYYQVNPQVSPTIEKIYTSVLTRTYINKNGYRIMLSIPYGIDQSDALAAHDPEGCYPSQGFQILSKEKIVLKTGLGDIPLRRMETVNGPRHEPVTYWFTVGNLAVNNQFDRKLAQLRYAFKREIPDGMLVRVSSIDPNTVDAYRMQDLFVKNLLKYLPPKDRERVIGL